jgi:hypothetical protein
MNLILYSMRLKIFEKFLLYDVIQQKLSWEPKKQHVHILFHFIEDFIHLIFKYWSHIKESDQLCCVVVTNKNQLVAFGGDRRKLINEVGVCGGGWLQSRTKRRSYNDSVWNVSDSTELIGRIWETTHSEMTWNEMKENFTIKKRFCLLI